METFLSTGSDETVIQALRVGLPHQAFDATSVSNTRSVFNYSVASLSSGC
jgi:hypothetical protein